MSDEGEGMEDGRGGNVGTEVSQVATLLWKDVGAGVGPHRHAHKQRRECIREATQSSSSYCSAPLGPSEKKVWVCTQVPI